MCIYVVCIHVGLGMCACGGQRSTLSVQLGNLGNLPAFTSLVLGLHAGAVHANAGALLVATSVAGSLPVVSRLTSPRIYFLSGRSDRECAEVYLTFENATWPHQISP